MDRPATPAPTRRAARETDHETCPEQRKRWHSCAKIETGRVRQHPTGETHQPLQPEGGRGSMVPRPKPTISLATRIGLVTA